MKNFTASASDKPPHSCAIKSKALYTSLGIPLELPETSSDLSTIMDEVRELVERTIITRALSEENGNRTRTAERLGLAPHLRLHICDAYGLAETFDAEAGGGAAADGAENFQTGGADGAEREEGGEEDDRLLDVIVMLFLAGAFKLMYIIFLFLDIRIIMYSRYHSFLRHTSRQ